MNPGVVRPLFRLLPMVDYCDSPTAYPATTRWWARAKGRVMNYLRNWLANLLF